MPEKFYEELKKGIFENGLEAIEDFLGYEIDPEEDKDTTDSRMDEVLDQMPDDVAMDFYRKYCGMKTLDVTIQCMATYCSSIQVPAFMSRDEAIAYAKEHLDEASLGTLDYVPDSDELDEENCDFSQEED